jgi:hypothetical protein
MNSFWKKLNYYKNNFFRILRLSFKTGIYSIISTKEDSHNPCCWRKREISIEEHESIVRQSNKNLQEILQKGY